ncbi:MAG: GGDEF domain-containing protein [Myxococcales bacterium]|nr:GGDEF domain-containing protein [Myxococcales bacterium]
MSNLLEQLRKASSIPSPPGVALEILNLNQGDDIDIDELAEVVTRDPAIVAKLLRMANSANFGRPGQVSDIRQAIMTLGLRSVNLLALSFSLASYSKGEGGGRFDYQRYWTSTAVITTASSILAKEHLSRFKDEVFLASILCDFGQLILAEAATKKYRPVLQRKAKSSAPLHEIEREILDTDHAEIGGELLGEWGLPTLICNAVQHHHAPHKDLITDDDARALAQVLQVASMVADLYTGTDMATSLEALQSAASEYFGMDSNACQELLESTEANMAEIGEMLGLECDDPGEIAAIRVRATEYLVKQSIALHQQIEAVSADSAELKKRNVALEERATTDALTGLRNRGYFDEWIESERERAGQTGHPLGLLLLDIDHFKSVNDDHGHPCGDDLLRAISAAIQQAAGNGNIVCRYGGEEIAIIAPETDYSELAILAEKLREAVAATSVTHDNKPVQRTVSIGGYANPPGQSLPESLCMMKLADEQLYRAKSEGRDRIFIKGE